MLNAKYSRMLDEAIALRRIVPPLQGLEFSPDLFHITGRTERGGALSMYANTKKEAQREVAYLKGTGAYRLKINQVEGD